MDNNILNLNNNKSICIKVKSFIDEMCKWGKKQKSVRVEWAIKPHPGQNRHLRKQREDPIQ